MSQARILQVKAASRADSLSFAPAMEATRSFETSVDFHQAIRPYVPDGRTLKKSVVTAMSIFWFLFLEFGIKKTLWSESASELY
jgi:hypothetical protein